MRVIETIAEMAKLRTELATPLGFVPTMGYLHEGHLSLVRKARAENATVIVSIFVNPTQFGAGEDLARYPRDIERDLKMLAHERTDIVFIPKAGEMYPTNFSSWVEAGQVTERLEGATRPGHFRGVATVVAKLFNIVNPTRAYFGQKDAQQLLVIKRMATDLNMNLEIIPSATIREPDGLAMSSRNVYLNPEERQQATVLFKSLEMAKQLYRNGEKEAAKVLEQMLALIRQQPLAQVDYASIADNQTLEELDTITPPALVSLAVRFGGTRLIDNVVLE